MHSFGADEVITPLKLENFVAEGAENQLFAPQSVIIGLIDDYQEDAFSVYSNDNSFGGGRAGIVDSATWNSTSRTPKAHLGVSSNSSNNSHPALQLTGRNSDPTKLTCAHFFLIRLISRCFSLIWLFFISTLPNKCMIFYLELAFDVFMGITLVVFSITL